MLAKGRAFAIVATVTLAVGIGSSTVIFSALQALVIRPFEYPHSDRIVHVWSGDRWPLSPADYLDLREQMSAFEHFGAYTPASVNVGAENPQAVFSVNCDTGVLESLGVEPAKGRFFTSEDQLKGAAPVAIISYGLWKTQFHSDPDIIGAAARMNGEAVTIVGVMPERYEFAGPWIRAGNVQVWLPMRMDPHDAQRDSHWLCGVARLKPGSSVASADAEIKAIGKRLAELYPNSNTRKEFLVRSLHFEMTRDIGSHVWLLFVAVILVLLVACANVASMLLARCAQRQSEYGVRLAIGATKSHLMRLALAESLVLAVAGAVLGMALAYGGIEIVKLLAPTSAARKEAMSIGGVSLLFTAGATLFTALLAGLPPTITTLGSSIGAVIRTDTRGAFGSRSRHRMLKGLVIAQVAVAFILANGAFLFSRSYTKLLEENQNLDTEFVLYGRVNLQGRQYDDNERRVQFWERIEQELQSIPGVTAVGLTSKQPLLGGGNTNTLVNDEVYDPAAQRILVERSSVTSDYFKTIGLNLIQGRNLQPQDDMQEDGRLGVVVNQAMVDKAWPDKNPLGELMRANQQSDPWYTATVVGVVENVRQWGPESAPQPEMYTTPPRHWGSVVNLNVRSSQPAMFLVPKVREALARLDPELALQDPRTLHHVVRESTQGQRSVAGLVNFFMATALGLVAVGLYGTLSYHVLLRTREIGVRMAIGAQRNDIVRLVLTQGLRWIAAGLTIGVAGVFALSRIVASLAFGVDGVSYSALGIAMSVVLVAGAAAVCLPARRAAQLDPLAALRVG